MARTVSRRKTVIVTIAAWLIGIVMFFPILWTLIASLKNETDAYTLPQNMLATPWTLENYSIVQDRSDYLRYLFNTSVIVVFSTLLGLVLAIPAAWSMAFAPQATSRGRMGNLGWAMLTAVSLLIAFVVLRMNDWQPPNALTGFLLVALFIVPVSMWVWTRGTTSTLLWILSTKMMPPAGALIPIYLIFNRNGLIFKDWGFINLSDYNLMDSFWGFVPLMTLFNLPIMIWMLFTYFKEIPVGILEAARMDGANLWNELTRILTPMALPGIASTCLLNAILTWNEAFWSLNLTNKYAAPLAFMISEYSSPEGQFWAKLSAASIMAITPILIIGWFSQRQLVRGLTFGAVK